MKLKAFLLSMLIAVLLFSAALVAFSIARWTPPPPSQTVKVTLNVDLGALGPRTQACVTGFYIGLDGQGSEIKAEKPTTKLVYEVTRGDDHTFGFTAVHKYARVQTSGQIDHALFYQRLKFRAVADQELTVYVDSQPTVNLDILDNVCSR